MEKGENAVLILDCGGAFPVPTTRNPLLKAELTMTLLPLLGYDAVNIGRNDLGLGSKILKELNAGYKTPLLSSNLVTSEGEEWVRDHIVKTFNGLTVAFIGLMPEQRILIPSEGAEEIDTITPAEAVKKLLPSLRRRADLVILISQLSMTETEAIVAQFEGIDFAITCGPKDGGRSQDEGKRVVGCSAKGEGRELNYVQLSLKEGKAVPIEKGIIELDDTVAQDPRIMKIISNRYNEEMRRRREARKAEMLKFDRERLKTLELSPSEFFELEKKRKEKEADQSHLHTPSPARP